MLKQWEYFDKYIFSAVDLNGSPHTFNNLEGDKYDYRLYVSLDDPGVNWVGRLQFNGDTGANYRRYYLGGAATTASAFLSDASNFVTPIFGASALADYRFLSVIDILGSSGSERIVDTLLAGGNTSTTYIHKRNGFWKNTADELNSISFFGNVTDVVSGEIYLFRRQKESVYNASDWELIEKQAASAADLSGSPLVFNNLQGDVDKEYRLEMEMNGAVGATTYQVQLNGDTTAGNYTYQDLLNTAGSLTAATGTALPKLNETNASSPSYNTMTIQAASGVRRAMIIITGGVEAPQQYIESNWWSNTADEIISITIKASNANAQTGTARLYKRSKHRSTSSHERLIYDYDISGDFSGGQEFKNLDTNKMYRISLGKLKSSADFNIEMEINGDTGANYVQQYLRGTATTSSAATATNNEVIPGKVSSDYPGFGELLIFPKTGKYRPMLIQQGYESGAAYFIEIESNWWANTADALQDIKFFASAATSMTGNIKVWEIDLL